MVVHVEHDSSSSGGARNSTVSHNVLSYEIVRIIPDSLYILYMFLMYNILYVSCIRRNLARSHHQRRLTNPDNGHTANQSGHVDPLWDGSRTSVGDFHKLDKVFFHSLANIR